MNKAGVFLIFIFFSVGLHAQNKWVLKKEKNGIKISARHSETSAFNDIQVEMNMPGTIDQISAILKDVATYPQWAYATKLCTLIRKVSDNEIIYYSEFEVPWPASNRDLYADVKLIKDSASHSLKVTSVGLKDLMPEKKGIVRVPMSNGNWIISTLPGKAIHVNYILQAQPGGFIPAWILNIFSTKGPLETFVNLKQKMEALNK